MGTFEIYINARGEHQWRLRASNNKIIADSAESYVDKRDCEHGIQLVKQLAPTATIEDQTANRAYRL